MRAVSDKFKEIARRPNRKIEYRIIVAEIVDGVWKDLYTYTDEIISAKISESIAVNKSMEIGNAIAGRLDLVVRNVVFTATSRVAFEFRFVDLDGSATDWLRIGRYFLDTKSEQKALGITTTTITAYDNLIRADRKYKSKLEYPASMADVLAEVLNQLKTQVDPSFVCQDYTIETKPSGYTRRQILGFIAASHGANVAVSPYGWLLIRKFVDTGETLAAANCISQTMDSDPWEAKKLIIFLDDDTLLSDDEDEDDYGAIVSTNPFATVDMAIELETELLGTSYNNTLITAQGFGWYNCGDILNFIDIKGVSHKILITDIVHNFSKSGYTCTYTSSAPTDSQSNNRFGGTLSDKIEKAKTSAETAVKIERNGKAITVGTTTETLIKINFSALKGSLPIMHCTAVFNCLTSGNITFGINVNSAPVKTYTSYMTAGNDFKHFFCAWEVATSGGHTVTITVTSADGSAVFAAGESIAIIQGQGLSVEAPWDGTISVAEKIPCIAFGAPSMSPLSYTAAPTISKPTPINQIITAAMPAISFGDISQHTLPIISGIVWQGQSANYTDYTTVVVSFKNPVHADDGALDLSAWSIYGAISGVPTAINIVGYEFSADGKKITFTTANFAGYDSGVFVSYDEVGNLRNSLDNTAVTGFIVSMIKT